MPPRSLRVGTRLPNPGAVLKGCPRPTAIRFDASVARSDSGWTLFGDGSYSGNIMQNGVVLQPQYYLLDGVTPLTRCIVVTGPAVVVPDWATTGAAAFMCHNLVLDGAAATLSASVNCKGLLGFVNGRVVLRGGATLHMNKLGKAGAFGDLSPDMLLPPSLSGHIATYKLKAYVVRGRGADGGAAANSPSDQGAYHGNSGNAAGPMQTGGGGSGNPTACWTGHGGCGGPCCGGAGSGNGVFVNTADAGDYGGPGTNGAQANGWPVGGGAGDPVGIGAYGGPAGEGPGGGLLILCARAIDAGSSTVISADGARGGYGHGRGGSAGGGCIIIVTSPRGYTNQGTVRAAGGVSSSDGNGGDGGAGSVNIFETKG